MKETLFLVFIGFLCTPSCANTEASNRTFDASQIGHAGSGVLFPDKIGEFQRTEFEAYDDTGLDVGAFYTRRHLIDQIHVSLFVYPALPLRSIGSPESTIRSARKTLLEKEFEAVKRDIFSAHPNAEIVMEDRSTVIVFGKEREALIANFLYTEKIGFSKVQFFSTAALIGLDQWAILQRITAPEDTFGRSLALIQEFSLGFLQANEGTMLLSTDPRNN